MGCERGGVSMGVSVRCKCEAVSVGIKCAV